MKQYLFIAAAGTLFLFACKGSETQSGSADTKTPVTATVPADTGQALEGAWELEYIDDSAVTDFDAMYLGGKPIIRFEVSSKKVSGNTSCNNFTGPFTCDSRSLKFSEAMVMTKMACKGAGEPVFLKAISKVSSYKAEGGKLEMYGSGPGPVMRFTRYR